MPNALTPEWGWEISTNGGETFCDGPYPDRDSAAASAEPGDMIAECLPNHMNLSRWFDVDRWLDDTRDRLEDADEDSPDEDGHHPLDDLTKEQTSSLQVTIRAAIDEWQQRYGLSLRTYWLRAVRHEQTLSRLDIWQAEYRRRQAQKSTEKAAANG